MNEKQTIKLTFNVTLEDLKAMELGLCHSDVGWAGSQLRKEVSWMLKHWFELVGKVK